MSKVCEKFYIDEEGGESRTASAQAVTLEFRFANGEKYAVHLSDHNADILTCLSWFGVSEKYGNSYAGVKGDAGEAEEKFLSMQEQLTGGIWVDRAEGVGPMPTLVVEAIAAAILATGREPDRDAIREKIKDKDVRTGALKDPRIRAEYEKLRAERQAAKAAKAAEEAEGAEVGEIAF